MKMRQRVAVDFVVHLDGLDQLCDRPRNEHRVTEEGRLILYLDDFLLWNAGALEYWVHVLISSVGHEVGWAARTEIPYITDCPAPTAGSNEKWADGAVVWPDGLAALIEIKTVPMRAVLGATINQVPRDLAALLATDWEAAPCRARHF